MRTWIHTLLGETRAYSVLVGSKNCSSPRTDTLQYNLISEKATIVVRSWIRIQKGAGGVAKKNLLLPTVSRKSRKCRCSFGPKMKNGDKNKTKPKWAITKELLTTHLAGLLGHNKLHTTAVIIMVDPALTIKILFHSNEKVIPVNQGTLCFAL